MSGNCCCISIQFVDGGRHDQQERDFLAAMKLMLEGVNQYNDWAATGCVEPTLQGQHFKYTAQYGGCDGDGSEQRDAPTDELSRRPETQQYRSW